MSVLTRRLDMDLMEKSLAVKETVEHRMKWGWESVFYHIRQSLKHLNYEEKMNFPFPLLIFSTCFSLRYVNNIKWQILQFTE